MMCRTEAIATLEGVMTYFMGRAAPETGHNALYGTRPRLSISIPPMPAVVHDRKTHRMRDGP